MPLHRRSMLQAGSVAVLAAGTLAAIPAADVALLAACAEFHRLHAAVQAASAQAGTCDRDGRLWTELDAALAARWAVSDRIEELPAATSAGRQAKAKVALSLLEESQPEAPDSDVAFAWAALRDVATSQ